MKAAEYFNQGYSCSESIIMEAIEQGIVPKELLSVATSFSGGMSSGCLCGAIAGSQIVLGWLYGKNNKNGNDVQARALAKQFIEEFKKSHKATGDELYISSFAISPKARKYGIGKILFNYLIDNVDKLVANPKSLLLVVAENWISARNIYIKKGFHEVCKLKDFFDYSDIKAFKADGIVMRKLL